MRRLPFDVIFARKDEKVGGLAGLAKRSHAFHCHTKLIICCREQ